MIRRWNLTILIILLAFVVGIGIGYVYRDRYSKLLPNEAELEREQADLSQQLFRTEVSELLRPETGLEAFAGTSEVYNFTGRITTLAGSNLTLEEPSDATPTADEIDFLLTNETIYVTLDVVEDENGLPQTLETELNRSDLNLGDIVAITTAEDMKTATERHVTKVQKIN